MKTEIIPVAAKFTRKNERQHSYRCQLVKPLATLFCYKPLTSVLIYIFIEFRFLYTFSDIERYYWKFRCQKSVHRGYETSQEILKKGMLFPSILSKS